jgi:hypothetical protein
MAHIVTCVYCKQKFDRDRFPYIQVASRRYAHKDCSISEDEKIIAQEHDKNALENYIMTLFNTTYLDPRIRKQIKQYVDEYNYTYSGIHKALIYHFEIKGGSVEKANGGIGIVPYVYQAAYRYYYALWEAQQKNKDKVIIDYKPTVKEIIIPIPKRQPKKRNLFSFLDDEEEGVNEQ